MLSFYLYPLSLFCAVQIFMCVGPSTWRVLSGGHAQEETKTLSPSSHQESIAPQLWIRTSYSPKSVLEYWLACLVQVLCRQLQLLWLRACELLFQHVQGMLLTLPWLWRLQHFHPSPSVVPEPCWEGWWYRCLLLSENIIFSLFFPNNIILIQTCKCTHTF